LSEVEAARIPTVLARGVAVVLLVGCDHTSDTLTSPSTVVDQVTPAAPAATAGVLRVDSAALIEYQVPGEPMRWLYAPQLRVTETSGIGPVTITAAEISIPDQAKWVCMTYQTVGAGQTIELFPSSYGDYGLSFEKPGHRSSGDGVVVVLSQHGSLPASAPITPPGQLPPPDRVLGGTWTSCRAGPL
jgi:hypothetical protein